MPAFEDLTGKKIGYLTILSRAEDWIQPSGQHKRMWHCLCECGKVCDVRASDLKSGNTTSCGCRSSRRKSVGLDDLTGKQFGNFLVINRAPNRITPSGQQTRVWHCKCGIEKDIQASQLKSFSGKCICRKKIKETLQKENVRLRAKKRQSIIEKEERKLNSSLAYVNPELASEWDYKRNDVLNPYEITASSGMIVWWLGKCGHEYQMGIGDRTNQNCGCPYCSGKRVLQGFNDLETWCKENEPNLLSEWCYEKNKVLPSEVMKASDKRVYWKCRKCAHIWKTKIDSRTRMKSGCPKCANYYRNAKKVINLTTNKVYESMIEAANELNINRACIGNVCRGKQKTAGGYRWAFYNEE